jgi:hypothetical protein
MVMGVHQKGIKSKSGHWGKKVEKHCAKRCLDLITFLFFVNVDISMILIDN